MEFISRIKELVNKLHPQVVKHREHLHQYPELSFQEFETSKYIQKQLDLLGIDYQNNVVETGIIGSIKGKSPEVKNICLRADIDALPIVEQNTASYSSKNEGVMHACGHDMHTASLLGTLRILNELKDEFEGTVHFVFQPGEEKLPGGASLILNENILQSMNIQNMLGQHVYPELEVGKVGFRAGKYMASTDEIYVSIIGKGGHGALPHNNIDPISISAQIITALQQLVSRSAIPYIPTVLSFGKIYSDGGATNVIPEKVNLEGTFRTFDEDWRKEAHSKIHKIVSGIAESYGAKAEVNIVKGYPFLSNDNFTTNIAKTAAIEYLGQENVIDLDLRMTAEDFAYYSQIFPSTFYRIGTSHNGNYNSSVHTPNFDIHPESLKISMGLMAWISIQLLKEKN